MLIWALGGMLCACESGAGPKDVKNPDPWGKIPATVEAGNHKDSSTIPQLITDLESDDPAVRFYAIGALERITGKTFGFQYFVDEDQRAAAVQQWKAWLAGWEAGQRMGSGGGSGGGSGAGVGVRSQSAGGK